MTTRMRLRRDDGSVYLERWGYECKWFGVYLHRMDAPDPGVHLHNHPWQFASLILKGGYTEERTSTKNAVQWAKDAQHFERHPMLPQGTHIPRGVVMQRRWLSFKGFGYNECHRITHLNKEHSWSLIFRGPKRYAWGFYTEDGYVESDLYHRTADRGMIEERPNAG